MKTLCSFFYGSLKNLKSNSVDLTTNKLIYVELISIKKSDYH